MNGSDGTGSRHSSTRDRKNGGGSIRRQPRRRHRRHRQDETREHHQSSNPRPGHGCSKDDESSRTSSSSSSSLRAAIENDDGNPTPHARDDGDEGDEGCSGDGQQQQLLLLLREAERSFLKKDYRRALSLTNRFFEGQNEGGSSSSSSSNQINPSSNDRACEAAGVVFARDGDDDLHQRRRGAAPTTVRTQPRLGAEPLRFENLSTAHLLCPSVEVPMMVPTATTRRRDSEQHPSKPGSKALLRRTFSVSIPSRNNRTAESSSSSSSPSPIGTPPLADEFASIGLQSWHELAMKDPEEQRQRQRRRTRQMPASVSATPARGPENGRRDHSDNGSPSSPSTRDGGCNGGQAWRHLMPLLEYYNIGSKHETKALSSSPLSLQKDDQHHHQRSSPENCHSISMDLFLIWVPFWETNGYGRESFQWTIQVLLLRDRYHPTTSPDMPPGPAASAGADSDCNSSKLSSAVMSSSSALSRSSTHGDDDRNALMDLLWLHCVCNQLPHVGDANRAGQILIAITWPHGKSGTSLSSPSPSSGPATPPFRPVMCNGYSNNGNGENGNDGENCHHQPFETSCWSQEVHATTLATLLNVLQSGRPAREESSEQQRSNGLGERHGGTSSRRCVHVTISSMTLSKATSWLSKQLEQLLPRNPHLELEQQPSNFMTKRSGSGGGFEECTDQELELKSKCTRGNVAGLQHNQGRHSRNADAILSSSTIESMPTPLPLPLPIPTAKLDGDVFHHQMFAVPLSTFRKIALRTFQLVVTVLSDGKAAAKMLNISSVIGNESPRDIGASPPTRITGDATDTIRQRRLQKLAFSVFILILCWRQRKTVVRFGRSSTLAILAPIRELVEAIVFGDCGETGRGHSS